MATSHTTSSSLVPSLSHSPSSHQKIQWLAEHTPFGYPFPHIVAFKIEVESLLREIMQQLSTTSVKVVPSRDLTALYLKDETCFKRTASHLLVKELETLSAQIPPTKSIVLQVVADKVQAIKSWLNAMEALAEDQCPEAVVLKTFLITPSTFDTLHPDIMGWIKKTYAVLRGRYHENPRFVKDENTSKLMGIATEIHALFLFFFASLRHTQKTWPPFFRNIDLVFERSLVEQKTKKPFSSQGFDWSSDVIEEYETPLWIAFVDTNQNVGDNAVLFAPFTQCVDHLLTHFGEIAVGTRESLNVIKELLRGSTTIMLAPYQYLTSGLLKIQKMEGYQGYDPLLHGFLSLLFGLIQKNSREAFGLQVREWVQNFSKEKQATPYISYMKKLCQTFHLLSTLDATWDCLQSPPNLADNECDSEECMYTDLLHAMQFLYAQVPTIWDQIWIDFRAEEQDKIIYPFSFLIHQFKLMSTFQKPAETLRFKEDVENILVDINTILGTNVVFPSLFLLSLMIEQLNTFAVRQTLIAEPSKRRIIRPARSSFTPKQPVAAIVRAPKSTPASFELKTLNLLQFRQWLNQAVSQSWQGGGPVERMETAQGAMRIKADALYVLSLDRKTPGSLYLVKGMLFLGVLIEQALSYVEAAAGLSLTTHSLLSRSEEFQKIFQKQKGAAFSFTETEQAFLRLFDRIVDVEARYLNLRQRGTLWDLYFLLNLQEFVPTIDMKTQYEKLNFPKTGDARAYIQQQTQCVLSLVQRLLACIEQKIESVEVTSSFPAPLDLSQTRTEDREFSIPNIHSPKLTATIQMMQKIHETWESALDLQLYYLQAAVVVETLLGSPDRHRLSIVAQGESKEAAVAFEEILRNGYRYGTTDPIWTNLEHVVVIEAFLLEATELEKEAFAKQCGTTSEDFKWRLTAFKCDLMVGIQKHLSVFLPA